MADKKSVGHAYNVDFLNVVFAASSIFLFVTTILMIWDDYAREWKDYQRRFVQLEMEVTQASLAAAQAQVDPARVAELRDQLAQAEQEAAASQDQIDELQEQLEDIEADLFLANQEFQSTKAVYDAERYEFEELQENDPERAAGERAPIDEMYQRWLDLGLEVERLTAQRDELRAEIGVFTGRALEVNGQLRELTSETERLTTRVADLQPSLVNDLILNAPLLGLHGADHHGPTGHHAADRRGRELRARREDGSLHDVPPGDRPRGIRGLPAAVPDAFQPGRLRRQCVAASGGRLRLHRLPRGDGAVADVPARLAHPRGRGADARLGA